MGSSLVWLALSGGEVTLVKYLDLMLIEARKRCKNLKIVTFTTNALLPKKVIQLSEQVKANGFDLMVTISLDGDEELHDRVRGVPGNYKKCIELYDSLKAMGVNVNFGITVSDVNESYIRNEYKKMRRERMKVISQAEDFYYELTGEYSTDYPKVFSLVEAAMDSLIADSLFVGNKIITLNNKKYNKTLKIAEASFGKIITKDIKKPLYFL